MANGGKNGNGRKKPAKSKANAGSFRKGQSGNPSGRVKGVPNRATREWKEIARSLVEDEQVQKNLLARLRAGKADKVFIKLCDYAHGVPKQAFILEDPAGANPFASIVEALWKSREGGGA